MSVLVYDKELGGDSAVFSLSFSRCGFRCRQRLLERMDQGLRLDAAAGLSVTVRRVIGTEALAYNVTTPWSTALGRDHDTRCTVFLRSEIVAEESPGMTVFLQLR